MKVIDRFGVTRTHGRINPSMIILHHTVSPTVVSAERGLNSRGGLGYHFIVDVDGTVYQYGALNALMYHAAGYNRNSIGISMVGGGKFGPITGAQIDAVCTLINENIKPMIDIDYVTGHKHATSSGKIDPRFDGEPADGIDWHIDMENMTHIANATGLTFVTKGDLK